MRHENIVRMIEAIVILIIIVIIPAVFISTPRLIFIIFALLVRSFAISTANDVIIIIVFIVFVIHVLVFGQRSLSQRIDLQAYLLNELWHMWWINNYILLLICNTYNIDVRLLDTGSDLLWHLRLLQMIYIVNNLGRLLRSITLLDNLLDLLCFLSSSILVKSSSNFCCWR